MIHASLHWPDVMEDTALWPMKRGMDHESSSNGSYCSYRSLSRIVMVGSWGCVLDDLLKLGVVLGELS